jgi:broad specificity phosphatase PhoE
LNPRFIGLAILSFALLVSRLPLLLRTIRESFFWSAMPRRSLTPPTRCSARQAYSGPNALRGHCAMPASNRSTSPTSRTRQTADPLAKALNLKPIVVPINSAEQNAAALASKLRQQSGHTVLVVNHQDALPLLIQQIQ